MKRIVTGILVAVMVLGAAYGAAAAIPLTGVANLESTSEGIVFTGGPPVTGCTLDISTCTVTP